MIYTRSVPTDSEQYFSMSTMQETKILHNITQPADSFTMKLL